MSGASTKTGGGFVPSQPGYISPVMAQIGGGQHVDPAHVVLPVSAPANANVGATYLRRQS